MEKAKATENIAKLGVAPTPDDITMVLTTGWLVACSFPARADMGTKMRKLDHYEVSGWRSDSVQ